MREISAKLDIEAITPHDLRRSFASTIASLGFGRQAIDDSEPRRPLDHRVYDRYSYAKEDQAIMRRCREDFELIEGRDDAKVVPLRQ